MQPSLKACSTEAKTKNAFVWTRILDTPFWVIFNMMPYILYKELHATELQLAIVIALKPLSSLLSMYWSSLIHNRRDRLVPNIIWGGILRHLPFFFLPFTDNQWFYILAFGFHMILARGAQPAWVEILKLNIGGASREKVFAWGSTLGYVGDAVFGLALAWALDQYVEGWRWLFPATALLSLLTVFFQRGIPIENGPVGQPTHQNFPYLLNEIKRPWTSAWNLLKSRPDFVRFQIAFMLGGSGLMVLAPMLPLFFKDFLNLSYKEIAIALTVCKGIGFAITSPLWVKWMQKVDIFRFTGAVTVMACLFPVCLMMAQYNILWLYIGYVGYGVMQAGSNLSWNLSGPIFSQEKDSSVYTSVNVITVGLRGCVAPFLGSGLCALYGPFFVLAIGGLLCLAATSRLNTYSREYSPSRLT